MLCLSEKNTDVFCKDTYLYYINQIFSDFSYGRDYFFTITAEKKGEKRGQGRKTKRRLKREGLDKLQNLSATEQ